MTTHFAPVRNSAAAAAALIAALAALASDAAFGAGFAIQENSGSGLGNAYAGGAASAEDASTVWFNAAGMARLGSAQLAGALNLIQPSIKFANAASQAAALQPLGGEGGNAGGLNVVPNLYITLPLDTRWTLGLGVNAPFGLVTEYDSGWIGRFQALKSEIKTINVNPAVAWKATDGIAIGAGLNYQKLDGTFTSNANYAGVLFSAAQRSGLFTPAELGAVAASTAGLASNANVTGGDHAWGWNLGVLVDLDAANRIGLHYRSAITYSLTGNVEFANPDLPTLPAAIAARLGAVAASVNAHALYNSGVTSQIKMPEIVNLSYFGTLNPKWDVMADLQYTGWRSVQDLTFVRTDGNPLQSTTENFKDAWRVAVGANYRLDEQWKFRAGLAYDQSPVQDAYRTSRLPDADRTWLALGAQYTDRPLATVWRGTL